MDNLVIMEVTKAISNAFDLDISDEIVRSPKRATYNEELGHISTQHEISVQRTISHPFRNKRGTDTVFFQDETPQRQYIWMVKF